MRYRKKPVVVEAFQMEEWVFASREFPIWFNLEMGANKIVLWKKIQDNQVGYIETLEGDHRITVDDFIIKGIAGEIYPCKPGIFKKTYEKVGD